MKRVPLLLACVAMGLVQAGPAHALYGSVHPDPETIILVILAALLAFGIAVWRSNRRERFARKLKESSLLSAAEEVPFYQCAQDKTPFIVSPHSQVTDAAPRPISRTPSQLPAPSPQGHPSRQRRSPRRSRHTPPRRGGR
jgi:hypothetical protein